MPLSNAPRIGYVVERYPRYSETFVELVFSAVFFAVPCVVGNDGDREGLPTVLLEAMALGTPCVSTDVAGIPEVFRDGDRGLCVPQETAGPLAAEGLGRLLASSDERVRIARKARVLIAAEFDVHRNGGLVRGLFGTGDQRRLEGAVA